MKISYRLEKKPMQKPAILTGVRKPNEPVQKITKAKKPFSWKRVLAFSFALLLIETIVAYVAGVPIVRGSLDAILFPQPKDPVISYKTIRLQFAESIPTEMQEKVKASIQDIAFQDTKRFEFVTENPDLLLTYKQQPAENDTVVYESYLIPVGHLYWVRDSVTLDGLKKEGIYISEASANQYKTLLPESWKDIPVKTSANLLADLQKQETTGALIDLNELDGQYKVQQLDGKYFFSSPEGGIKYSLVLTGNTTSGKAILQTRAAEAFPASYKAEDLLSIRMTGVTAITRSLGIKTNASKDPAYAARKIGDFLSKADLTHVSNEVSFLNGCAMGGGVSFCALPTYIEALKKSGVDIVELTGNHNNDKGATANTNSINIYKSLNWDYFGGGLNSADAAKILYKEVKGTKVAFLGYNYYDSIYGTGALAGTSRAGANSWSAKKMAADVAEARKNANVVIVTFQYQECWAYTDNYVTNPACYKPLPSPNQSKDFRQAVDAGADIVVGTQAHQPQTYEIYKGKVIFYGLGNLYFDQIQWLGTRQGLVLTHYMYKGKYLGTEITTTLYGNDLLTYVTSGNDRTTLLKSLKNARN